MKSRKTTTATILALAVAGAALGGYWTYPLLNRDTETFLIQIDGLSVVGSLTSIQSADISGIASAAKIIDTEYPLMSIRFIGENEVEIKTGVVRGPLDGSGRYHTLKKLNGKWQRFGESSKRWIS